MNKFIALIIGMIMAVFTWGMLMNSALSNPDFCLEQNGCPSTIINLAVSIVVGIMSIVVTLLFIHKLQKQLYRLPIILITIFFIIFSGIFIYNYFVHTFRVSGSNVGIYNRDDIVLAVDRRLVNRPLAIGDVVIYDSPIVMDNGLYRGEDKASSITQIVAIAGQALPSDRRFSLSEIAYPDQIVPANFVAIIKGKDNQPTYYLVPINNIRYVVWGKI